MANADGQQIPIVEDDQGEGLKELWKDFAETYPERVLRSSEDLFKHLTENKGG